MYNACIDVCMPCVYMEAITGINIEQDISTTHIELEIILNNYVCMYVCMHVCSRLTTNYTLYVIYTNTWYR